MSNDHEYVYVLPVLIIERCHTTQVDDCKYILQPAARPRVQIASTVRTNVAHSMEDEAARRYATLVERVETGHLRWDALNEEYQQEMVEIAKLWTAVAQQAGGGHAVVKISCTSHPPARSGSFEGGGPDLSPLATRGLLSDPEETDAPKVGKGFSMR